MTENQPAVSRSQERFAIAVLAVGAFAIAVNVNLVGAMWAFVREAAMYQGLDEAALRLRLRELLWVTGGSAFAASVVLGPVVDRFGRRGPMLWGGALFALGMASHLVVADHTQFLVARALSGAGGGLVFTSASAAVADLTPYNRRGAAMGVFSLGLFLATPVGLPVGLLIADGDDEAWRAAFAWLGIPGVLAMVGYRFLLPADLGRAEGGRVNQLQVLREPAVIPALLSVMLYTGAFFISIQLAAPWLHDSGILPRDEQMFLWVVLGFSTAAGALVLPRIADRVGKRNVVLFTTGGVAICLMMLARVDGMGGLWLVGIPLTLLASARTPALAALMSEIVEPRMRGTLMGLRAAAVNLGAAVFAVAGGQVYAESGYDSLLYASTATMVVAYLLVRFFVRVQL